MRNKKEYPENWGDTIRPDILKRDNYKCTKCGVKHRTTYVIFADGHKMAIPKSEKEEWQSYGEKVITVYLQIAHLDHLKHNHAYDNLAAMCVKCHLNYDRDFNNIVRKSKLK